MKRYLAIALAAATAIGCSSEGIACPDISSPGVAVDVRDVRYPSGCRFAHIMTSFMSFARGVQ
jgi:hypothetical protein